jgi:hypothetical protein
MIDVRALAVHATNGVVVLAATDENMTADEDIAYGEMVSKDTAGGVGRRASE